MRDWRQMKPFILAFMMLFAVGAQAQEARISSETMRRVRPPVVIVDTIGGDSHNIYAVRLRKGQRLRLKIRNLTGNGSHVYFDTVWAITDKRFGKDISETEWSGVAPKTGDYWIRVVAYPTARYRLKLY